MHYQECHKSQKTLDSLEMKPVSSNLVGTKLANVAISTQVPTAIIAAHQDESSMVHLTKLKKPAVFTESEEAEAPLSQRRFLSGIKVPVTPTFPQFSSQDLIKMQAEDPSRDFMKYWATNKKPSTRVRYRLSKKGLLHLA